MGRRGPAGKPTKLRLVDGNPSRRPIPVEPPLPDGAPDEPDWTELFPLNDQWPPGGFMETDELKVRSDASAIWQRTVPMLEDAFLVRQSDYPTLIEYAVCWARLRQAERLVSRTRGAQAIIVATRYRKTLLVLLVQLGLTPSARIRLAETDPAQQNNNDPIERMFNRQR